MPARNYFTQQYSFFNQLDPPTIVLCNPNMEKLYSIGSIAHDVKLTLRFNAVSDLSFTFPKSIDKTNILPAYNYIKVKRLILIENVGYFIITSAVEKNDGSSPVLLVECKSIEMELSFKKVIGINGTSRLFNSTNPTSTDISTNLLGYLISLAPTWSIGGVDSTIASTYRTFDISDSTMYDFMINDMEKAYNCIFTFDLINKKIYVDGVDNATTSTDIYLSYENLIKSSEFSELSDEIVTALSVYGGNDLDIRAVNPTGSNYIYNFNYYKTTEWMTQGLITNINAWEAKIAANQANYALFLSTLRQYNADLGLLETNLSIYQSEYATLEIALKVAIETNTGVKTAKSNLAAKQSQITYQNGLISAKQAQITTVKNSITSINNNLSFTNNFTQAQILELSNYIIQNTYQNENIIITDKMTPVDIQDNQQELYDQAKKVLERVSVPRYEFSVETANFVALKEFKVFTDQVTMGSVIKINTEKDYSINAVLLELEITYDKLTDFRLTFSNRLRLDNGAYQYSDLANQVVRTGSSVSFNSPAWSNWNSEYKDEVSNFIKSSLDATKNELINSTNQEIKINGSGLRGRRLYNGQYESGEVWLTSNVLAFTDDNWNTAKAALGKITVGGVSRFGLVAESIVGNIIAGNNLIIKNNDNSFVSDSQGTRISNGTFSVSKTTSAGVYNEIRLDPNVGLTLTSNYNKTLFSASLDGTVSFTGSVRSTNNNIQINADGTAKIGLLQINNNSAVFSGNIYASNLLDQVPNDKIGQLDASKVTSGIMSGDRIYGGEISHSNLKFDGGYINTTSTGKITIGAGDILKLTSNNIMIGGGDDNITLNPGNGKLYIGATAGAGTNATVYAKINGQKLIEVRNGIVTGVYAVTIAI